MAFKFFYYNHNSRVWLLAILIQIHIFDNIIEEVESRWKIVFVIEYYKKRYTLHILHIFLYYVHSVYFCTFEFSIDV